MKNIDYTLYLCTDRDLMSSATIEESVEQAIKGGVTVVQLREKDCSSKDFYELALRVKKITDEHNIPLIINDRVDIALAVDAAGVHIGQSDLPASVVRKIIGEDKIVGVSAAKLAEANPKRLNESFTLTGMKYLSPPSSKSVKSNLISSLANIPNPL